MIVLFVVVITCSRAFSSCVLMAIPSRCSTCGTGTIASGIIASGAAPSHRAHTSVQGRSTEVVHEGRSAGTRINVDTRKYMLRVLECSSASECSVASVPLHPGSSRLQPALPPRPLLPLPSSDPSPCSGRPFPAPQCPVRSHHGPPHVYPPHTPHPPSVSPVIRQTPVRSTQ